MSSQSKLIFSVCAKSSIMSVLDITGKIYKNLSSAKLIFKDLLKI